MMHLALPLLYHLIQQLLIVNKVFYLTTYIYLTTKQVHSLQLMMLVIVMQLMLRLVVLVVQ